VLGDRINKFIDFCKAALLENRSNLGKQAHEAHLAQHFPTQIFHTRLHIFKHSRYVLNENRTLWMRDIHWWNQLWSAWWCPLNRKGRRELSWLHGGTGARTKGRRHTHAVATATKLGLLQFSICYNVILADNT